MRSSSSSPFLSRRRLLLAVAFFAVIALGLASRRFPGLVPASLGKYPGDALWALMVFIGLGFIRPRARANRLAALAFAIACAVEFSQLYQAPWINGIRRTTLGHLVLGSAFAWGDIVAYGIGVLAGLVIARIASRLGAG